MSANDNKSIHEFDFNLICEYFSSITHQGPGSEEMTLKALSFIDNLTAKSKIADLGCGTGAQTIALAKHTNCHITALDLFPAFIDKLKTNAEKLHLGNRIQGITGTMEKLPFQKNEFDVIWSEGAIYNIGFQRGLKEWRKFLKKDGYIAVTEASWFTDKRPNEINQFWTEAYPEIDTIPHKVAQMQNMGYIPTAVFILPEKCWTENFYQPQIAAQEIFLKKYAGNKTAEELVENQRYEASLYSLYKSYYGYVFYIGQKNTNICEY